MDEDLRTQIVARGGLVPLLRLSSSDDVEIQMEVRVSIFSRSGALVRQQQFRHTHLDEDGRRLHMLRQSLVPAEAKRRQPRSVPVSPPLTFVFDVDSPEAYHMHDTRRKIQTAR